MADLLLELFSEEIPARMQLAASEHLSGALSTALAKAGLAVTGEAVESFVTPRRVAVIVKGLPVSQPDVTIEHKGPKIGAPEAAMAGFLKKTGLTQADLAEKDGVWFASVHQKGKPTAEVLKTLIEELLAAFPWPKSMRWGSGSTSWVRPLHSILCLFDGNVIPVEFAGVKAGNTTYGHRFLAPAAITISKVEDYEAALEKAHVLADRDQRMSQIQAKASEAAAAKKLAVKPDEGLKQEVVGLVEWPVLLTGSIDDKFMDLPPEVLTTVMRSHQKYFSLLDADGKLAKHFLITANMVTADGGKAIIAGNERVLRARFSDARFFWDLDRKKPLSDWAKSLKDVTFHAKLGTVADKVLRIEKLADTLAASVPGADKKLVQQAARLCKADLVTGMVGEFAELQGIMGRYYAQGQKEDQSVADAIRDHYKPQGPGDSVPSQPVSICVALADKLDTLISMFAIGEKPTGSKDPFALRRAALGVIRIVLENNIRLPLKSLLNDELVSFFHDRLIVQLKDQGIRHDVIKAVVADGDDDLVRVVARAKAVQEFLGSEDGKNLLAAYKRAANLVSAEEKKDKTSYKASELKAGSLTEAAETDLAKLLASSAPDIDALRKGEKFAEAMKKLSGLRAAVDHFFDKIMVNADDKELRANRLRLLSSIKGSMDNIANFALIEG